MPDFGTVAVWAIVAVGLFFTWRGELRRRREMRLPPGPHHTEDPQGDDVRAARARWEDLKRRRARRKEDQ